MIDAETYQEKENDYFETYAQKPHFMFSIKFNDLFFFFSKTRRKIMFQRKLVLFPFVGQKYANVSTSIDKSTIKSTE